MTHAATTSALILNTLAFEAVDSEYQPKNHYPELAVEGLVWQGVSHNAVHIAAVAKLATIGRGGQALQDFSMQDVERLVEILGLMGSIGEQAGMARAADLDAQRVLASRGLRDELHQQMLLRHYAEAIGHFSLGAAHSMANLVLRMVNLNDQGRDRLSQIRAYRGANGFAPNQGDNRHSWLTLNEVLVSNLESAVAGSPNAALIDIVASLRTFYDSDVFKSLDQRRGMDYHRRRPQTVPHTANPAGVVRIGDGGSSLGVGKPTTDPESRGDLVYQAAAGSLPVLTQMMRDVAQGVGEALRSERIQFDEDHRWNAYREQQLAGALAYQAKIDGVDIDSAPATGGEQPTERANVGDGQD